MIADAINNAVSTLWGQVVYYLTFQFVDPFYYWFVVLIALYGVVLAICWFFGTYFPILRVIGGVLLLIATFGLFAYSKGEKDARAHDKARTPKPKPQPRNDPNKPWWS